MNDKDLFNAPGSDESDVDENRGTYEKPMRYKHFKLCPTSRQRSCVVLQTSCSSEEDDIQTSCSSEEDDSPPRSRAKPVPEISHQKSSDSATATHRSAAVRSGKVPLLNTTNRPTEARIYREKENKTQDHSFTGIEKVLLETNQLLRHVIKRVDKCEKQIKSFESTFDEVTGSSSTSAVSTPSRKKSIPEEVRRETRCVYYVLLEEDEGFVGWNCTPSVTFKSSDNQRVVNQLVTEVKGLNDNFLTQHIRDAAYRFYRSQREEQSLKRRGKSDMKQKKKRRHERKLRKLDERSASLSKMKFADAKDREKWEKVMTIEFISSEDSGSDNDDEVLIVRPLPWRSARVDHMFINNLDKQSLDNKSPLAKRQMMRRVLGLHSHRSKSSLESLPQWVFSS